jgi:uroporphyrinogen decarboxylase
MWLEYPVKSRKDWEKIKEERFNLDSIDKRYVTDIQEFKKKQEYTNLPVLIMGIPIGFFGSLRFLLGEKNLYFLYYDDPKLLKDISNHLCNLWLLIAEELTSKVSFDFAYFFEDMAGKNGSLISPAIFKEFMAPNYKRIIKFLRSKGINIFIVDSDGNINDLIPIFLGVGINAMQPFEQQSGNDLIKIRKKYPELRILGGFDKNTLTKDKEYINLELERMKIMISMGGFIPFIDHHIPPNVSWENFKYYRNSLNKIIEQTTVLL